MVKWKKEEEVQKTDELATNGEKEKDTEMTTTTSVVNLLEFEVTIPEQAQPESGWRRHTKCGMVKSKQNMLTRYPTTEDSN